MKKEKKFFCEKCGRDDFKSNKGVMQHDSKAHPYIAPPEPKKTVEVAEHNIFPQRRKLLNAATLDIGDVFYRVEKCVLKKITRTEGSRDIDTEYEITKSYWTRQV
jgi:hypothetical protein